MPTSGDTKSEQTKWRMVLFFVESEFDKPVGYSCLGCREHLSLSRFASVLHLLRGVPESIALFSA